MKWAFVSIQTMTGGNLGLFLESTASTAASIRIRRRPARLHTDAGFPARNHLERDRLIIPISPNPALLRFCSLKVPKHKRACCPPPRPPPVNVSEEEEDYL